MDKLRTLPTKLNIASFTFTGDGNDAIFPLLNEVMHHPDLLASLRKHFYLKIEPEELPIDLPIKRIQRRIQRKPPKVEDEVTVRMNHSKPKRKEYQRTKFTWKPPKGTSRYTKSAKLELQSKFAEQVRKNTEQFEEFCQCVPLSTRKENSRAIFGPSPFPPVINELPKRIARDLVETRPLKFPWNGVFDTEIRVVKRRNPSILFSFENQSIHSQ